MRHLPNLFRNIAEVLFLIVFIVALTSFTILPKDLNLINEKIIGDNNLLDINVIWKANKAQKTVVRIKVKQFDTSDKFIGTSSASGFLVRYKSKVYILTNEHVIGSRKDAENATFQFDYARNADGTTMVVKNYYAEKVVVIDARLDYALVVLKGNPENDYGYIDLDGIADTSVGLPLNSISHPNGDYKKIAYQGGFVITILKDFVRYTTDTMPGSSGGLILDNYMNPIALHTSSLVNENLNQGALLTSIIEDLNSKL